MTTTATNQKVSKPTKKFTKPDLGKNCPIYKRLVTSRVRLLLSQPFFGTILVQMPLVDATDDEPAWLPTAATDSKYIYYNREFVHSLSDLEIDFLMGHELLHCVLKHIGKEDRRNDRDPLLWNIAGDYVINNILVDEDFGSKIKDALFDTKYRDMSTEEVYEELVKDVKKNGCKYGAGSLLDVHLDPKTGKNDAEAGGKGMPSDSGEGNKKKKGGPPSYSEDELKEMGDKFRNTVIQATHAARAVGAGNIPAGIDRLIKQMTQPKVDWREMLDVSIKSHFKDDFTFSRPSRKGWDLDVILPAMEYADKIEVVCTIDTSGSMTDEMLSDFLSEVKGIMMQFADFKLELFTFDTKVYNHKSFDPSNVHDIDYYKVKGGGGTDFEVVWKYMKKKGIMPKQLVFLTDGEPCGEWGDPNYCDTLFIIHSHRDEEFQAPFGQTVHYDSN